MFWRPMALSMPDGGFDDAGSGGSFDGFAGEAFDDEGAEGVEIDEVGEFDAVAEGAAGRNDGIAQAE